MTIIYTMVQDCRNEHPLIDEWRESFIQLVHETLAASFVAARENKSYVIKFICMEVTVVYLNVVLQVI